MEQVDLCGTGVALITPFNENGTVDYTSLGKIVDHVVHGGVDYLVVMGTTGESVTVNKDEKQKIINYILDRNNNQIPVVLGIGGNNTLEIAETLKKTDLSQIYAILSVSPYYNKPNQEGIYQHYKYIANISELPVIIYNVPGRTGRNVEARTTLRLAHDFNNIIAIKEASGDLSQIMEIIKNKPENFMVISGDDSITFPLVTLGGCGVISVIANAFPAQFANMVHLLLSNNITEAKKIHYLLLELIKLIFKEGNPAGIKAVLNIMNLAKNVVRLPLVPVSKELYDQIADQIKIISES